MILSLKKDGLNVDEPVWIYAAGIGLYYYHYDGLGSVVAVSDGGGNILERYEYDVFGEVTIRDANGQAQDQGQYGNPYFFTGRRLDDETGLYYYRERYYSPQLGRFLQPDPIGYMDGLNLYTYTRNNPVNRTDPMGMYSYDKPVDPVTKGTCNILKCIPYFKKGAKALEMGWCNNRVQDCVLWCNTSDDVPGPERDICMEKCRTAHAICVINAGKKKCAFKFKI